MNGLYRNWIHCFWQIFLQPMKRVVTMIMKIFFHHAPEVFNGVELTMEFQQEEALWQVPCSFDGLLNERFLLPAHHHWVHQDFQHNLTPSHHFQVGILSQNLSYPPIEAAGDSSGIISVGISLMEGLLHFGLCLLAHAQAAAAFWCFLAMQRDGLVSTVSWKFFCITSSIDYTIFGASRVPNTKLGLQKFSSLRARSVTTIWPNCNCGVGWVWIPSWISISRVNVEHNRQYEAVSFS